MNGEESPPKLSRRRAKGYGEFRHPFQDASRGSAGSFTPAICYSFSEVFTHHVTEFTGRRSAEGTNGNVVERSGSTSWRDIVIAYL